MGFNISWLAVEGKEPQGVLDELGLVTTGRSVGEVPESAVCGTVLANNGYLVWIDHFDRSSDTGSILESLCNDRRMMKKLSAGGRVVVCHVQEMAMYSEAECWTSGRHTWTVEHDSQAGIRHLQTVGSLPRQFESIYEGLKKQQDEHEAAGDSPKADYIHDVPISLAQLVTSFRHDTCVEGASFEVLEQRPKAPRTGKRWWRLW